MHTERKPFISSKKKPTATGWRQSAKVNCAVLLIFSTALTAMVIVLLARGSLNPVFFYAAKCDSAKVAACNLALHLLINIASTLVVLNAPTRQEVDNAHFKSSWLGIGVSSVRNAFLFEVDRRESDYHLTIATEQFLHGGDFYPPGSSLVPPGLVPIEDASLIRPNSPNRSDYTNTVPAYGFGVNMTDYNDHSSPVVSNISTVATEGAVWERLDIEECKVEYIHCRGLKKHGSVILVVDKPGGWVRNDIWRLNKTQAEFWDQYIPPTKPNHLFFDAQCVMLAEKPWGQATFCINNCETAIGSNDFQYSVNMTGGWNYRFFDVSALSTLNESMWPYSPYNPMTWGLQQDSFNLNISYCLAEPLENICQIGLSPTVLLGVALCVITKTITALIVTIALNRPGHDPLVTLGDAVASFIEHPDPVTAGLCTVDQKQFRIAMRQTHASLVRGPRQWTRPQQMWAAAIPMSIWQISYALFASGIITCAILLYEGLLTTNLLGSFLSSDSNSVIPLSLNLIQGVLLANSPQLLLSFCYLAYNNLFTRLQMAKEWARFGEGYNSLRVTEPRATGYFGTDYFNEPYGYHGDPSLPAHTAVAVEYSPTSLIVLIIVSSVLVTIPLILALKRLPSNITQPGSNSLAISAACHSPTISRASREPPTVEESLSSRFEDMPSSYRPVRTCSSANLDIDLSSQRSSRKSSLWRSGPYSTLRSWFLEERKVGKEDGVEDEDDDDDEDNARGPFRRLAQSRLRWGVISVPAGWYGGYGHDGPVGHLGFGAKEDKPKDPVPGHMYA
ncbi:hypothetical protein E0Z10_g10957 [Xylaria hypoxylon]|uniref:DUF6536 domain-containing protein n=1 Tax=Xylaria hypoxylon TaxID=37992 RepID=A0A4Z0YFR8_9PEZI|nr:hypothetical protein E0Z10_g10957 [Xylaria hypoxylon]